MSKKRVLIVDDDKDIQAAIKMILELNGYVVDCVSNGKEALESVVGGPKPAVILLDLMMPVMDGFEFLRAVESGQLAKDISIIVMTAARNKASEIKRYAILLKPFEVSKLIQMIEEPYKEAT